MATPKTRASRVFTISFPEDLARQVEQVALEESRSISELFREAFRTYRLQRAHRAIAELRSAAEDYNAEMYTQDDIERFVDESRKALGRKQEIERRKAAV